MGETKLTDEEFSLMVSMRDAAIQYTEQHPPTTSARIYSVNVVRGMMADFAGHMILADRVASSLPASPAPPELDTAALRAATEIMKLDGMARPAQRKASIQIIVRDALAEACAGDQGERELGDPLWPLYQEYMSMVPPKGEVQMTYSGWLRRLADRLQHERNTPAMAKVPPGKNCRALSSTYCTAKRKVRGGD